MEANVRVLIKNGLILTLDPDDHVLDGFDVLIEDGLIARIAKDIVPATSPAVEKVIDASGKLVMPGLVNAHLHSYDVYMKGLYEDLPLELWMPYLSLSTRRPLTQHEIYVRTLRVAAEMLKNGVTAAHDFLKLLPIDQESLDTVMSAYRDAGIRALVGVNMANKPPSQTMPYLEEILPAGVRQSMDSATIPPDAELLDFCGWMIREWDGKDGILHVALDPSAPQRCTDEFMLAMDDLSRQHSVPLTTHVLETKVQAVTGREFYGKSIVEHLSELDLLTRRLSIVHGVWLTDHDIELLAAGQTSVVHNPLSNLKLLSGIAPVRDMVKAGINVALGCDNNNASDAQNVFDAMRVTALLHQVSGPDYGIWEPARETLRMATAGGATSLLLQDQIASLEVGKRADIVLLDLHTHPFSPLNQPVRQLVYSESGRSVDTVLVNGRVVVEAKVIRTVDEQALLQEVNKIGQSLLREHKKAHQAADKLQPYLDRMYRRCVEEDVGLNRYSRAPESN
jgi:5-methylthioadenosine/S-adenosylhomocysteine deaminase